MLRISGRKKLLLNIVTKTLMSVLFGFSVLASLMFFRYKPVYKVSVNNIEMGYIANKNAMEKEINRFILNGDADNVAYVIMNAMVDYEMMLVEKDMALEDHKILAAVKDKCDIYYKVYAIKVGDEEKCIVESFEDAESMKKSIDDQQAKFANITEVEIIEKNVLEYEKVEDFEVAVADIMKPLQEANDNTIKIRTQLASSKTVSKEVLKAIKENLTELNFRKPVDTGVITSRFGWRSSGYHYGLDIGLPQGEPIYACESGVVTYSAWLGNYGYLVKVQHTGGYETYYAHCSKLVAEVGDEVQKGDLIAYVGSTGRSSGPHVHLEVRFEGKNLDPEIFVYDK